MPSTRSFYTFHRKEEKSWQELRRGGVFSSRREVLSVPKNIRVSWWEALSQRPLAGRERVEGEAVPSGGFGDHGGDGVAGQQGPHGSPGKVRWSDLVPLPLHFFIPPNCPPPPRAFPVSQVQSSLL